MEAASFAITLNLLTAFARTQRASSLTRSPTEKCREQQKDGDERIPHTLLRIAEGKSPAELAYDSASVSGL